MIFSKYLGTKREKGVSLVFVLLNFNKKLTNNQTKQSIDKAHTSIDFKVRHLMISHIKGAFEIFDGNIYTNWKDFITIETDFQINHDVKTK